MEEGVIGEGGGRGRKRGREEDLSLEEKNDLSPGGGGI